MGLIDKIRSSLPIPGRSFRHPEPAAQLLAFVLLERTIGVDEIVALVATVPGASATPMAHSPSSAEATDPTETSGPVEITLGGTTGFVLEISAPVPDGEAEASAANNAFWPVVSTIILS